MVECPNLSCTILGLIFWDRSSVAWVCLKSWKVICSRFNDLRTGRKYLVLKLLVDKIFPNNPVIKAPDSLFHLLPRLSAYSL